MVRKHSIETRDEENQNQSRLIGMLKEKNTWMKWTLLAMAAVILLLILFLGYATDWGRGLFRGTASSLTPTGATVGGNDTPADSAATSGSAGRGSSVTNNAVRETSNTSNTTNSSTSQGAATDDTTKLTEQPANLLQLLSESSVGQNADELLARAATLELNVYCEQNALLETCVIEENGQTMTVKSLSFNGTVSSIVKNF